MYPPFGTKENPFFWKHVAFLHDKSGSENHLLGCPMGQQHIAIIGNDFTIEYQGMREKDGI
jgi:hypothetical protein